MAVKKIRGTDMTKWLLKRLGTDTTKWLLKKLRGTDMTKWLLKRLEKLIQENGSLEG